jgi:uncharacterized protein (DUF433 family)
MPRDLRFDVPLYTLTEASRYLMVPRPTLTSWIEGNEWRLAGGSVVAAGPIITALPVPGRRHVGLPFVGLAETYVLNAFRRAGVPMQRIGPSVDWLVENVGPHALASKDLLTEGADALRDFAQQAGDGSRDHGVVTRLIVPKSGKYVFKEIVEHYLKQVGFGGDNFADMIRLAQYGDANVVLDPYRGYGEPVFDKSGAKVADALGPLRAGETFESVADDFGVSEAELRDALAAIAA